MKKSVLFKILFLSFILLFIPLVSADYGDSADSSPDYVRMVVSSIFGSQATMVGGADCSSSVSFISEISSTSSFKKCNFLMPGKVISVFEKAGSDISKVGVLVDHFTLDYQQCTWVNGIVSSKSYLVYEWYCKGTNQMCVPGNVCVNSGARAYQNADCTTPSITSCQYGCVNGLCTVPPSPTTCVSTKLCKGSSLYQQNTDCSQKLISDCPNGCVLNSCATITVSHTTPTSTPPVVVSDCFPNDVNRCNGKIPESCVFGQWLPKVEPECPAGTECSLVGGYAICRDVNISKCPDATKNLYCADLGLCVATLDECPTLRDGGVKLNNFWIYIGIGVALLLYIFKPVLKKYIRY